MRHSRRTRISETPSLNREHFLRRQRRKGKIRKSWLAFFPFFLSRFDKTRVCRETLNVLFTAFFTLGSADKSLARPGRKPPRKMSGTQAISTTSRRELSSSFFFYFLQGKAPKEIHVILAETLTCFLPGWAKDL